MLFEKVLLKKRFVTGNTGPIFCDFWKSKTVTSALSELGHIEVIIGSPCEGNPVLNESFLYDVIRVEVDRFTWPKINRHYISVPAIKEGTRSIMFLPCSKLVTKQEYIPVGWVLSYWLYAGGGRFCPWQTWRVCLLAGGGGLPSFIRVRYLPQKF